MIGDDWVYGLTDAADTRTAPFIKEKAHKKP